MKRAAVWAAMVALGMAMPLVTNRVGEWWNAPPAEPGAEAAKIIASLESGEGWEIKRGRLRNGGMGIITGVSLADLWLMGESEFLERDESELFTYAERRRINAAAKELRKRLEYQQLMGGMKKQP